MALLQNYLRKRTGSRDLGPSSRASKVPTADSKRFTKVPASSSGSSRRDALPRSASANAISSSLASRVPQRKNSLDACSVGSRSSAHHSSSSADSHRGTTMAAAATTLKGAHEASVISDAEAVRRFLLDDIKKVRVECRSTYILGGWCGDTLCCWPADVDGPVGGRRQALAVPRSALPAAARRRSTRSAG